MLSHTCTDSHVRSFVRGTEMFVEKDGVARSIEEGKMCLFYLAATINIKKLPPSALMGKDYNTGEKSFRLHLRPQLNVRKGDATAYLW